jgi:hypothetical protein
MLTSSHPASPITTNSTYLSLNTTFWKPSTTLWSSVVTMAPLGLRTSSARPIICLASFVTSVLLTASTSLIIVDISTGTIDLPFWRGIAIAAVILGFFALLFITILTVLVAFVTKQWTHRWLLPWFAAILVVMAASLSIVALVLKKTTSTTGPHASIFKSNVSVDLQLALWTLATIAELVFYILISIHWNYAERRVSFVQVEEKTTRRRTPPAIPEPPPTSLRMIAPPYALPEAGMPAPEFDVSEESKRRRSKAESRGSWRDSIHQVLHPRTSQNRLLTSSRSSFSRDSSVLSDTRSIATTFQSDGFDNWDTSNVDVSLREALAPTIPTRGRALETIPGSRPSSPGKPLEGPFKDSSPDSPASSILERPTTALSRHERPPTAQSTYSKRTFIPQSRPGSPDYPEPNESHIHPLFRSDSPTPPPATTPGTIVTAHSSGGQVIPQPPPRSASRMSGRISHVGSRNPSPATTYRAPRDSRNLSPATTYRAPRDHSLSDFRSTFRPSYELDAEPPSESRTGTMTSMSTFTGTLIGTVSEKSVSNTPERSRDTSPVPMTPRRVMTPPIPEFILSASRERLSSKSVETLKTLKKYG